MAQALSTAPKLVFFPYAEDQTKWIAAGFKTALYPIAGFATLQLPAGWTTREYKVFEKGNVTVLINRESTPFGKINQHSSKIFTAEKALALKEKYAHEHPLTLEFKNLLYAAKIEAKETSEKSWLEAKVKDQQTFETFLEKNPAFALIRDPYLEHRLLNRASIDGIALLQA